MRAKGLTLIELMVTVAILAIILAIALPSFTDFIDRSRMQGAVDSVVADIGFAKTEAARRNSTVYVKFGTGSGSCYAVGEAPDCACGTCNIKKVTTTDFANQYKSVQISLADDFSISSRNGELSLTAPKVQFSSTSTSRVARVQLTKLGFAKVCMVSGELSGLPAC